VRGGAPTRGFPPGSAQALVALVLGITLFVTGLQRDQLVLAGVFLGVGVLGGVGLVRLYLKR
jgi:hypothetical protein